MALLAHVTAPRVRANSSPCPSQTTYAGVQWHLSGSVLSNSRDGQSRSRRAVQSYGGSSRLAQVLQEIDSINKQDIRFAVVRVPLYLSLAPFQAPLRRPWFRLGFCASSTSACTPHHERQPVLILTFSMDLRGHAPSSLTHLHAG